jgi:hypothetical protein
MVAAIAGIEAAACDSVHEAAWLERNLLEAAMPRWNRTPGGQEVPVRVRLDLGPARPRLVVEHLPAVGPARSADYFGPYLGGRQVRLAVRGIGRCLPLGHAGTRLRGAERNLARDPEGGAAGEAEGPGPDVGGPGPAAGDVGQPALALGAGQQVGGEEFGQCVHGRRW